jgi:hypothetical protein
LGAVSLDRWNDSVGTTSASLIAHVRMSSGFAQTITWQAWEPLDLRFASKHLSRTPRRWITPGDRYSYEEEPSGNWRYADEYECLVDATLQILLRLTGIADGAPVADVAADEVRVDAPLPADVFCFVPPTGTLVVHVPWLT